MSSTTATSTSRLSSTSTRTIVSASTLTSHLPTPGGGAQPPYDASLDPNVALLLAHAAFMVVAIGVCIPLAIFYAHYFSRGELFQAHYWINTFGTVGLAIVGFALAALYHSNSQTPHLSSVHSILGIVVVCWLIAQQIGGTILHYQFDDRLRRAGGSMGLKGWAHYVSGVLVSILGCASVGLGIWRYGEW